MTGRAWCNKSPQQSPFVRDPPGAEPLGHLPGTHLLMMPDVTRTCRESAEALLEKAPDLLAGSRRQKIEIQSIDTFSLADRLPGFKHFLG